jgi:hypothetical protein
MDSSARQVTRVINIINAFLSFLRLPEVVLKARSEPG